MVLRRNSHGATSHLLTVTLVVFVALCSIGLWMMRSESAIPLPRVNTFRTPRLNDQDPTLVGAFDDIHGGFPSDAVQEVTSPSKKEKTPEVNEKVQETGEPVNNWDTELDHYSDNGDLQQPQSQEKIQKKSDKSGKDGDQPVQLKEKEEPEGENRHEDGESNLDESIRNEKQSSLSEDKRKGPPEIFPNPVQSETLNETTMHIGTWKTQFSESKNETYVQTRLENNPVNEKSAGYNWKICNLTTGPDYIPCLDNNEAITNLRSTQHYEHRERHCPNPATACLVSLPKGYRKSIGWPESRDRIWYYNVPHTMLAQAKARQNWMKVRGEHVIFPGGGTQFKKGAQHYIDFIQEMEPNISWGKRTRVILDVGCGVASFGGYLFDNNVLTMSFAPKDEHEAQVQFALERGIPAISAVMGTQRLPWPGNVFDAIHCARCRVPWHIEGGVLLLELNRLLRPGGYFVWSATPVYRNKRNQEDAEIWQAMKELTMTMCWKLNNIKYDKVNQVGAAVFLKPTTNDCYESKDENKPPMCKESDDPNAAWYVPLQACVHKVPVASSVRGSQWPEEWPSRLERPPYWLYSQTGVYGNNGSQDFISDYEHWKNIVGKSYLNGIGINWSTVRNVMDMNAVYGGFAAALKDLNVWVMNVVPVDSPDTLPVIFDRGLFGIYHDWCESFSTYPRSYDLLHADHIFYKLKKCSIEAVIAEVDRILRPEGKLIVRDDVETINEIENLVNSLHWDVHMRYSKDRESLLCVQKGMWRPDEESSS